MASLRLDRNLPAELMIELEVYAADVRDLSKILELENEVEAVPAVGYKVDSNLDAVYEELDESVITFRKLSLEPHFIGTIPPELRSKPKTQLLSL